MGILIITSSENLELFYIDKGLFSSSGITTPPSGTTATVTAAFGGETPGGSSSAVGVVTSLPSNVVRLLDQKKAEIVHAATTNRVFGRLTFSAGVWTLTYRYYDAAGIEQTIGNIATDTSLGAGLTDVQLAGVSKSYQSTDPARPFGDRSVALDTAWGIGAALATSGQGELLNTINGVNLKTPVTGGLAPILYTPPAGKTMIPTRLVVRITTGTGITGDAVVGAGTVAGETNVFAQQAISLTRTVGQAFVFTASGEEVTVAFGTNLRFGVSTGAVGTTLIASVDIFGYLK